jgi:elongator complex protein 2
LISVAAFLQCMPGIEYRLLQSIAIGVSSSRKLFATACKATTTKHAAVRMYDTESFRPFGQPLEGHTLTVTRIAFSPDDQYVLTVSRDRTWRLFHKEETGGVPLGFTRGP